MFLLVARPGFQVPCWRSVGCDPAFCHVAKHIFKSKCTKHLSSDQFLYFPCPKMARRCRCGANHICKSKCTKHLSARPILVAPMSTNGTQLWSEAHLQVKMYKTPHVRTIFGSSYLEKCYAAVARSTCASRNIQNIACSHHFSKLRCRKITRLIS